MMSGHPLLRKVLISCLLLAGFWCDQAQSQVRLKDLARLRGIEYRQLIGYGLVVGLPGTGDSKRSQFTTQSVVNMLLKFGVNVPVDKIKTKNIAAVMVTTDVPFFARKGDRVDITVSSVGDAKSLEGGVLLQTPLADQQGGLIAMGQGPLTVGGFSVETTGGGGVRQNYTLVGRVPQGAILQVDMEGEFSLDSTLSLSLKNKDITTANRMMEAINSKYNQPLARMTNPYTLEVDIPPDYRANRRGYAFLAELEQIVVEPDVAARVVINERTGTVVIGGKVTVLPAAIAHGNLSVEIRSDPIVSQPSPFSQGQTVVLPNTDATVYQDEGQVVTIENATTVQEVAQALNTIGLMPRDIIAVLQALKAVGALQAELEVM